VRTEAAYIRMKFRGAYLNLSLKVAYWVAAG